MKKIENKTKNKQMADPSTNISIDTLYVNDENTPIKRHRLTKLIKKSDLKKKKSDLAICHLQETYFHIMIYKC